MLKIRITFADTEPGRKELEEALDQLDQDFNVLNRSKVYQGRGTSIYSNIYLEVENK